MADLGKLWFGVDLDLSDLKTSIANGNREILEGLKVNVPIDSKSLEALTAELRKVAAAEGDVAKAGKEAGDATEKITQSTISQQRYNATLVETEKLLARIKSAMAAGGNKDILGVAARDVSAFANRAFAVDKNDAVAVRNLVAEYNRLNKVYGSIVNNELQVSKAMQVGTDAMRNQSSVLGDLKTMAAQYVSVWSAKEFLGNVIEVGGQLEKQRISMGAIIGDTARANELFEQIKDLAIKSPFGVVELDQYSKQLAAYGIEQSKLFDMTKRLADISAGAGQDIGRLALALGHVKSATYLTGITLRQFSMNNIPMLKMLADYYTEIEHRAVSTAEVQKRISKRQVSYDDVIEQIRRMTDDGGQFYNMQEKISESLQAKFKNLRDSLDIMYGEIAESKVGSLLKELAATLTNLSRHWQEVMSVVGLGAAIWVGYRVQLLAVNKAFVATTLGTSRFTVAQLRAMAAMNKGSLVFTAFGHRITIFNRLLLSGQLALKALRASLMSLVAAVPQMAAFAAIAGLVELWQKNSIEAEKAKELGDQLFERTEEGMKNLRKVMEDTGMTFIDQAGKISDAFGKIPGTLTIRSAKDIDMSTMLHDIAIWEEFIKNYAATPNLMLHAAYATDENGKSVHSLAEQYEILGEKAKIVAESLPLLADFGEALSEAIDDSDGGWLDDNLLTDMKDYQDAYNDLKGYALDLYQAHKKEAQMALEAARGDEAFAMALEKAKISAHDYTGQLLELAKGRDQYKEAMKAFGDVWQESTRGIYTSERLFQLGAFRMAERELEAEFKQVVERLKSSLEGRGISLSNLSEAEKQALLRVFTDMETKAGLSVDAVKDKVMELVTTEFPGLVVDIDEVEAAARISGIKNELDELVGGEFSIDIGASTDAFDVIDSIQKAYAKAKKNIADAKPILLKIGVEASGLTAMTDEEIEQAAGGSEFIRNYLKGLQKAQQQINDALTLQEKTGVPLESNKKAEQAAKKAEKEAEKRAKQRQKQFDARMKEEESQAKQLRELDDVIAELNVASIKNKGERERAQEDMEHEKRLRQIHEQVEEWKKESYKLAKEKWEAENTDKTKVFSDTPEGAAGWQGQTLTETQAKLNIAALKKEAEERKRVLEDRKKEDTQAMLDYLKEFGTVQERRYAIQREYDAKIADETRATQKKMLEAEKQKALDAFDVEVLRTEIDWATMFEGLGSAFEDQMKETLDKVEKYIQSDAFKSKDANEKAEIIKLRNELYGKTGGGYSLFDRELFRKIGEDMKELQDAAIRYKSAQLQHTAAVEAQIAADKELEEAKEKLKTAVTEEEKLIAEENLKKAKLKSKMADTNVTITGQLQKGAQGNVTTAQGNLTRSYGEAQKQVDNFSAALGQVTSGSLTGFVTGIANMIDVIQGGNGKKGIVDAIGTLFGNMPSQVAGIIAAILSIIDQIGDDSTKPLTDLFDKLFDAFSKVLEEAFNGDAAGKVMESLGAGISKLLGTVIQGIGNIFKDGGVFVQPVKQTFTGLGEGLASSFKSIFSSDNHEEQLALQEEIKSEIEVATHAINHLTDALEKSYGAEAVRNAKELEAKYKSQAGSQIKGLDAALWDNYGGGHSDYWHWNKNTNDIARQIAERYGLSFTGDWNSLFNNNDAEKVAAAIKDIRDNETEWWRILTTQGYNEGAVKEWLESLASTADAMEAAEKQLKEQLTGTTEEDIFSDFLSKMQDLANGVEGVTEDIAEDWQKMINKMVVNNIIGGKMREDLEAWYKDLVEVNERFNDGIIGEDAYQQEIERLRKAYNAIVDSGSSEVARLTEQGIIQPVAEATGAVAEYFENLRDSWKATLTDMGKSSEDWKNELIDVVLNDLVEKTILESPFDLMIDGAEKHFDSFSLYLEDWTSRYQKVLEGSYDNEADRIAALNALIEEQVSVREDLADKSKEIAAGIGKDMSEAFSNSLDNLGDTLLDTLLDAEKSVEDMGRELGQTLVREMLKEMLASEKYSTQIEAIREMWQSILKGEDTEHTIDDVIGAITKLSDDMATDEDIQKLTEAYEKFEKAVNDTTFTDMEDSFVNTLMDMDEDVEDFANDLKKTIVQKMVEAFMVSESIKPLLDDLQKTFDYAMGLDGMTPEERAKIIAKGYSEVINGETVEHSGLDDVAERLTPLKATIVSLLEAIGYKAKETEKVFDDLGDRIANALASGSAKDFVNGITETIVDEITKAYIATDEFQEKLTTVQQQLRTAMESGDPVMIEEAEKAAKGLYTEVDKATESVRALGKELKEDTTFKDMTDGWVTNLMDFEGTADDWAKEVGRTMAQRIIEQMIVPTLIQPLLDDLQTAFDGALSRLTAGEADEKGGYDWKKLLNDAGLREALKAIEDAYPELKKTVEGILSLAGIKPDEKEIDNALSSLTDTITDRLLTLDGDVEDLGKQIGSTLIREMIATMLTEGVFAEDIKRIKQLWEDILTGKDTTHSVEDVLGEIALLEDQIVANPDMSAFVAKWKELNAEVAEAKEGFSDLRGTIVSSLMDVEGDLESFRKNLSKTMQEQMLDAYINSRWKDQIAAYNQEWAEALESGSVSALEDIKQKVVTLYDTIGNTPEVQELANAIKDMERELDTTFSDMSDSWASALMDMEKTAEEWAQDVGKIIAEKIVKELIVPTMVQPLMDEMQSAMTALFDTEGATWGDVVKTGQEYLGLIGETFEEVHPLVEAILNSFGIFREETEATEEEVEYALGDLRSEFVNALMNMESDAEAFSQSIGKIMSEAFIDKYILGEAFDAQMEAWQQEFERINTSGLSEDERKRQLKQLQDAIASAKDGYASQAMAIQELLGLNASAAEDQKAAANIADKITYEQADELVGINMAQEMTLEQILATLRGGVSTAGYATATVAEGSGALALELLAAIRMMQNGVSIGTNSDIFNRLGYTNEYLRTIRDNNAEMLGAMNEKLARIDGKLARL